MAGLVPAHNHRLSGEGNTMSRDIESQLLDIIRNHCAAEVKDSLSLAMPLETTGIDSLGMAEIIFELEDRFGIEMPAPDGAAAALHFTTLQDLRDAIAAAMAQRS